MAWKEPPQKRSYACNPELLTFLRDRKGWTQQQLATAAGYSERLVCKAESGQSISSDTISNLAEALCLHEKPVYPEDLISDPVQMAKDYIAAVYTKGNKIVDAIEHFLDDEVVFRFIGNPDEIPFAGEHHGIEGMRRMFDIFFSLLEAPANHNHEPYYTFVGQGNVVTMWGESWIHPIGKPMEKPMALTHRFVFRRGKVVLIDNIYDTQTGKQVLAPAVENKDPSKE